MKVPTASKTLMKPRSNNRTGACESVVVLKRSVVEALRAKLRAEKAGAV